MRDLTARQRQVLDFISAFVRKTGYPPSVREIADNFGMTSTNAARSHLKALEKKGCIARMKGVYRGLRFTGSAVSGGEWRLPMAGSVPAGQFSEAVKELGEEVEVGASLFGAHDGTGLFALRVSGDSMVDAGIHNGDLAIVSPQVKAEDGDIVVAAVGDEVTLKRFRRRNGDVHLCPENQAYGPIVVTASDVGDQHNITGKVVGIIRTRV